MNTRPLLLSLALTTILACDHTHDAPPPSPQPTAATTTPTTPASAIAPSTPSPAAASDPLIGHPPPDFDAKAQDGTEVHLAALKGKSVVVYFYPKDETPGCTKEACAFRDAWDDLKKSGVVLIGISADSDESHRAFAKAHSLPFLLVSDPQGTIAKSFGVPFTAFTARQSFVIGPDGNVKSVFRKVDVTVHAKEIADAIKS